MRAALPAVAVFLLASVAPAQFAEPPADAVLVHDAGGPPWPRSATLVRIHVGPALELRSGDAGLFDAFDVGRGRVGARFSGSAVALGTEGGMAAGSAELWICPVELGPLRALLGAGAGLRDESAARAADEHELAAVAVFRGGLARFAGR